MRTVKPHYGLNSCIDPFKKNIMKPYAPDSKRPVKGTMKTRAGGTYQRHVNEGVRKMKRALRKAMRQYLKTEEMTA